MNSSSRVCILPTYITCSDIGTKSSSKEQVAVMVAAATQAGFADTARHSEELAEASEHAGPQCSAHGGEERTVEGSQIEGGKGFE